MKTKIIVILLTLIILSLSMFAIGQKKDGMEFSNTYNNNSSKVFVEILVEPNSGNVILGVDSRRVKAAWAEMLIRGTTGIEGIPFDASLYSKYYQRIIKRASSNSLIKVDARTNFREHQAQRDVVNAWDKPKFTEFPVEEMWQDLRSSAILSAVPIDSLTSEPLWMRWPWGRLEWKEFAVLEMDSLDVTVVDSIQSTIVAVGSDTLRGWRALKVDLDGLLNDTNKHPTFAHIVSDSTISSRGRYWLEKQISNNQMSTDITLLQALRNKNISNKFMQLTKMRVRAKWLNKQSEIY